MQFCGWIAPTAVHFCCQEKMQLTQVTYLKQKADWLKMVFWIPHRQMEELGNPDVLNEFLMNLEKETGLHLQGFVSTLRVDDDSSPEPVHILKHWFGSKARHMYWLQIPLDMVEEPVIYRVQFQHGGGESFGMRSLLPGYDYCSAASVCEHVF